MEGAVGGGGMAPRAREMQVPTFRHTLALGLASSLWGCTPPAYEPSDEGGAGSDSGAERVPDAGGPATASGSEAASATDPGFDAGPPADDAGPLHEAEAGVEAGSLAGSSQRGMRFRRVA